MNRSEASFLYWYQLASVWLSRARRICEKIGWQAKAPALPKRQPLCASVGQTLSSANPVIVAIFSQGFAGSGVAADLRAGLSAFAIRR